MDGRLDSRHAWRNDARGSVDIFRDRRARSTTKVRAYLLVDASGSMGGVHPQRRTKAMLAQDTTATLAMALGRISTVDLTVYQHSASSNGNMYIRKAYDRITHRIEGMAQWGEGGGNADGFALRWVGEQALRERRPDEKIMIIVISDGLPSVHGRNSTNRDLIQFSHTEATALRKRGVAVLSVTIEEGATQGHARNMYGPENVVPFDPKSPTAWPDLARGLADLFGRVLR
jgi:nitric oxide reductase activation protein